MENSKLSTSHFSLMQCVKHFLQFSSKFIFPLIMQQQIFPYLLVLDTELLLPHVLLPFHTWKHFRPDQDTENILFSLLTLTDIKNLFLNFLCLKISLWQCGQKWEYDTGLRQFFPCIHTLSLFLTTYLPERCPLWFRIYSADLPLLSLSHDRSPAWPWFCPDRHASCSREQIPPQMHFAQTFSCSYWSSYGYKCLDGFLSVIDIL